MALPEDKFTLAQFCFPEASGTTSLDNTGHFTATLHGTPTRDTDTPSGTGNSIVLNGTNQWITVASLLSGGFRNFTVAFWFKPSAANYPTTNTNPRLLTIIGSTSPDNHLDLFISQQNLSPLFGGFALNMFNAGTGTQVYGTQQAVGSITVAWHRIVVSCTLGRVRIYYDGVRQCDWVASVPSPIFNGGTSSPFTLGAYDGNSPSNYIAGKFAEIIVESRAWTQGDATADFTSSARYASIPTKLSASRPVIGGAAETYAVQEFNALPIPGSTNFVHTFTRGYGSESIYRATSPDGLNLNISSGALIGKGNGGESSTTCGRSFIQYNSAGKLYIFYTSAVTGGDLKVNTSTDNGLTVGTPTSAILQTAATYLNSGVGNGSILQDTDGSFKMALEGLGTTGWQIGIWTASSLDGPWSVLTAGPITALQPFPTGTCGGPKLFKVSGTYYMLYHGGSSGTTTANYLSSSPDLTTWTLLNDSIPVVDLASDSITYDQSADPELLIIGGGLAIYNENLVNATGYSQIVQKVYTNSLTNLLTDGAGGNLVVGTTGGGASSVTDSAGSRLAAPTRKIGSFVEQGIQ